MAQAAEITLSFAAKQIETVFQNRNAENKQFLGRDFQLVPKKVGYFDLIHSLQACIHQAAESDVKKLAFKAMTQLKTIAEKQRLEYADKIDLIDTVAKAALQPERLFKSEGMRAKLYTPEFALRKALTLLLIVKEYFIACSFFSKSKLKCLDAAKKRFDVAGAAQRSLGDTSMFLSIKPKSTNALALYLSLEEGKYGADEETAVSLFDYSSEENLQILRSHAGDEDPDVRDMVHKLLTFNESDQIIRQHDFVFDSLYEPAFSKTSIIADHRAFLDTYCPPILTLDDERIIPKPDDSDPAPHVLRIQLIEEAGQFDRHFNYIYKHFYTELIHRIQIGGKDANTTSCLPSFLKGGPDFALPAPAKLTEFFAERFSLIENHPKAPPRNQRKMAEQLIGPRLPDHELKHDEPQEAAPPKKERRPVLMLGPVDPNYSMAAVSGPVSAVQPAAAARGLTWATKGVAMAAAPASALADFDSIEAILGHRPAPKIIYSDRVGQYLEAPSHEIDNHWRHGFPLQLDAFLGNDSYVKKSTWINTKTKHPDTLYIMIGEVEVSKDNWKLCQFEWCVGEDGKCYHHFCTFNPNVLQNWMSGKAFLPENFPTLEESYLDATWKGDVSKKVQENIQMELNPVWKYITFTNKETNISCKIFRRGK